jgi:hypothetical protein
VILSPLQRGILTAAQLFILWKRTFRSHFEWALLCPHTYLELLVQLNCFLQKSKGSIALRLFNRQIIYKMDILSSLENIFMRSSSFPWYPTLLVTFINVFVPNRRWSSPKALISVLPENIDFLIRIRGRGQIKKKDAQSKKRTLTKE